MKLAHFGIAVALIGGIASPPAWADHEARFDFAKSVSISGTLTSVAWQNPRIFLYLDVKQPDGTIEKFSAMTGSPTQLSGAGISDRKQLVIGESYRIEANPERKPSKIVFIKTLTFADGKLVKLGM